MNCKVAPIASVDVSDIFYFFCSGEGKGESRRQEGGEGRFLIENARTGGGGLPGEGGGRGLESVCWEFGGGGG